MLSVITMSGTEVRHLDVGMLLGGNDASFLGSERLRVAGVVVGLLEITVKVLKALCCLRRLVQSLRASMLLVN